MTDKPRLIEFAFPLKQTSLDSVHEKNVRHGHISTLHIWPARRPLAACRAALIATLLPDPSAEPKPTGMSDENWQREIVRRRQELCEKIAGKVVKRIEKKKMPGGQAVEREKEETEGGILHWGREAENAETVEWFRQEIRKAYGGRAPKVLDPFAGGGAIPLEAMRLGCEATAIDINPVAWFILKCTLEYPQKSAGQKRPLPSFILKNRAFMESFFKAQGLAKVQIRKELERLGHADAKPDLPGMDMGGHGIDADLAWHVRAWGQWVLDAARKELAPFYPVYADFEPLDKDKKSYEQQPMQLVPLKNDGTPDIDGLNAQFSADYLSVKANPRWVPNPTVAYLWARTVICKNCRAIVPLLKTRWLCKKTDKRILLTMEPNVNRTSVVFGVETDVPSQGGNAAQKREHDKRIAAGTMSRAGARCPCCETIMTMEDLRVEGGARRLGAALTAVMVNTSEGRNYRIPTDHEVRVAADAIARIEPTFQEIPFGVPNEPTASKDALGFRAPLYGMNKWSHYFTPRQLLAIGTFVTQIRNAARAMLDETYPSDWREAVTCYTVAGLDRLVDRCSTQCQPDPTPAQSGVLHTFHRFAMPMVWDFIEGVTIEESSGGYLPSLEWATKVAEHALRAASGNSRVSCICRSSVAFNDMGFDAIITDPPYYDAIPYSDLMDFFYVWLRRTLHRLAPDMDAAFHEPLAPKWSHEHNDGELIDDDSRHGGDAKRSKGVYEDGMARVFEGCHAVLKDYGRLVIVFANKQPAAWETLVSALIRAGFVVDASWPIQTEMSNRMRAMSSAALASSVWLVCKKRPATARPGWDNKVLDDMRANISQRLREFWDAGIRGPDFVWAATGPALEAYSKHPVVKMANDPNATLTVSEFLNHARRMVVDFVVGRVLERDGDEIDEAAVDRLDETTAYYLLHRNDFGLDDAPVGACILYATACGLSDQELIRDWDLLAKAGSEGTPSTDDEDEATDDEPAEETGSGSKVKLKTWNHRRGRSLGIEAPGWRPIPLIDRIHRLMHLWKAGDVHKVDEYLDEHGLRRHELFRRVLQSLIELAKPASEERSLLESISNHIGAKGAKKKEPQKVLALGEDE
jgi:putative DNA methylase